MKLPDHVDHIRTLINKAFDNQFSRLGLAPAKMIEIEKIPQESHSKREKLDVLITSHTGEFGNYKEARTKALDELTFTLFNRLAAVKVMESLHLFPPVVTKQPEHGDRSFGHKLWLEENPDMRSEELEGLRQYFKDEFNKLGETIPLYHKSYPYALLPYVIDLNEIITAFNAVELDPQIDPEIWRNGDILGWLYESYNNSKKEVHKASKAKTEYHKVSLQSQVYTPRWVVEFLVNNSLGKLYLEMYPNSDIKNRFKIANAPETRSRELKPLHEIKMIDPASGSGNFLLYGFEFFYQLYEDQIENYGAAYDEDDIPKLIIENNLHGIDLDDRAIQLAQLGLWIKAKQKRRNIDKLNFNIVSSDFYLPDFVFVEPIFKTGTTDSKQLAVIEDIWGDLQQAYKFGSLIKIEEKISLKLHGLLDQSGITLFGEQELDEYESFKTSFLENLETAVSQYATQQGNSFLTGKTKDAITFLKLLTIKYDVATANPPYTDSSDFGPELKIYIDANYTKPYKFNTNLYASFITRCFELTNEKGKVAMIHPLSFMYIKSFEDVRNFILSKTKIDTLIEFGLGGIFLTTKVDVDVAAYILDKQNSYVSTYFMNLQEYKGLKVKQEIFEIAFDKYLNQISDKHNYELDQEKFKIIKSSPFIYWISDGFREKFKDQTINSIGSAKPGLQTGSNERFVRYWWEVNKFDISNDVHDDLKWKYYAKGGEYKKWSGNLWLILNWNNNGEEIKNFYDKKGKLKSRPQNEKFYLREGVTYSASGSKGASFRYLPPNCIFDVGGASVFLSDSDSTKHALSLLNSVFSKYVINCLNPTVNTQKGDIDRIPFFPFDDSKLTVDLADKNIEVIKHIDSFSLFDTNYKSPFLKVDKTFKFKEAIIDHINETTYLFSQVLISQSYIDKLIFKLSNINDSDKALVLAKEGVSIGDFPISMEAKKAYFAFDSKISILEYIKDYVERLPENEFPLSEQLLISESFPQIYKSYNDLEEFCIRHQINPISVWYWITESNVIPKKFMNDLALEFLADIIREVLMEDDDGTIPLVPNSGEKVLLERIEEKFIAKGFSMAQYSSFDSILGRELNDYINYYFFNHFSNHLNLFRHLPMTPFIWHLTSGPEQGFDCYIIIYKWNRDKLLRIRSVYIEHRERALINRQSDLANDTSAAAQNEKDKIYKQLKEIERFKVKIDELLKEGYNPILDDGVGKNIAPLQKKGMLAYEVLNAGQLKKYLNANW